MDTSPSPTNPLPSRERAGVRAIQSEETDEFWMHRTEQRQPSFHSGRDEDTGGQGRGDGLRARVVQRPRDSAQHRGSPLSLIRPPECPGSSWSNPTATRLTVMAFMAGATSRIKFGTGVLVIPYRPAVLAAKIISTIDYFSGGRVILGIGVGWMEEEFVALGLGHLPAARQGHRRVYQGLQRACGATTTQSTTATTLSSLT